MAQVFNKSGEELLRELSVSAKAGLSGEEAAQRLKQYGPNEIIREEKKLPGDVLLPV
jgi:magnesium-transporting ATPase (P-type)